MKPDSVKQTARALEVHERIRAHFDRAGLSCAQVAKEAARRDRNGHWTERKVQRLVYGHTDLKVEHVELFAEILGRSAVDMYRKPKAKPREGRSAS